MEVFIPNKKLHPFVSVIYPIKAYKKEGESIINEMSLPSGHCFLVFKSVGDFKVILNHKEMLFPQSYVTGQQTMYHYFVSSDDYFEMFAAALKPTALWHFFNLDMKSMVNNIVDVSVLFPDKLKTFKKQFYTKNSERKKLESIEGLLLDIIDSKRPKLNIIDTSIDFIQNANGCISVAAIAKKLNVSLRYFQKKFKQITGLTPSKYARITRFNYIFSEFKKESDGIDVKTLSAIFSYYDSAHFSKDFKKYCGISPTKFYQEKFNLLREIWIDDPMILKNDPIKGRFFTTSN